MFVPIRDATGAVPSVMPAESDQRSDDDINAAAHAALDGGDFQSAFDLWAKIVHRNANHELVKWAAMQQATCLKALGREWKQHLYEWIGHVGQDADGAMLLAMHYIYLDRN